MVWLGYIVFWIGLLIALVGDIGFLIIARRHGPASFWGCLFLPPVWLLFFVLNLKETWKAVVATMIGLMMAGFGCRLAGIDVPDFAD